ncbi:YibE/F family protein [Eupransor demetentiae]|uniref:Uncharacterized membrane protein n=1 Tax=Eupransor demetentiae TaxID=3109584 RepID=A0ABM9N341_9LACO|nr:Uncharacterized membrane protein [Lactobacillaceae bacterium LMG 33000]
MNSILLLILILLALMLWIGGKQGWKSFIGLMINFALIFILVILINWQFNLYLVTAVISTMILAVAIYLSSDRTAVMNTAFKTSLIVMAGLFILSLIIQHFAQLGGFTTENSDELEGLSLNIGLSFGNLALVVMIVSALGAVSEAAMAVTADLYEVIERNPDLPLSNLVKQRQIISSQIISTAINTLFFGMLGSNLPLLIWYMRLHYSPAILINAKLLVIELVTTLLGILGILGAIWLSSHFVIRDYERKGAAIVDEPDL